MLNRISLARAALKAALAVGFVLALIGPGLPGYNFLPTTQAEATLPPDEVAVKLKSGVDIATITARYNATVIGRLIENNVYLLKLGGGQTTEALLPALNADSNLYYAEPNYYADAPISGQPRYFIGTPRYFIGTPRYFIGTPRYFIGTPRYFIGTANSAPTPEELTLYWSWLKINLAGAQKVSGGKGVIVAVLDTGLAADHNLLKSSLINGYDFVGMRDAIYDTPNGLDDDANGKIDEQTGHGTHVAGIILTIAPEAQIMPVRVLNSDGSGTYWEVAQGIRYAVDHGAKIINLSLGAPLLPPSLSDAINYAVAHNVLMVAAAGNEPGPHYPASFADKLAVVGVGATDQNDQVADFSGGQPGDTDVYAPGVDILSAYPQTPDSYLIAGGTSMAAPMIAGEAALLMSEYPEWTLAQIKDRIINKTVPVPGTTAGRADLNAALSTSIEVQYLLNDTGAPTDNQISPHLRLISHVGEDILLATLKLRYWYTLEGGPAQTFTCLQASPLPCASLTAAFIPLTPSIPSANYYAEIGFTDGVLPAGEMLDFLVRLNKNDLSAYDENNDYSYGPANYVFTRWDKITVYRNNALVWGVEPASLTPQPTVTPAPTQPAGIVLFNFEDASPANWSGANIANGPWATNEWAANGAYALRADVNLGANQPTLRITADRDLTGKTALLAYVKPAAWGNMGSGMTAKLFVKTGGNWQWYDSGSVPINVNSPTRLQLNLSGVANLNNVREIGVEFISPADSSGASAVYLDYVSVVDGNPSTATPSPVPPTATANPTATQAPPTATRTNTPLAPTATTTPATGLTIQYRAGNPGSASTEIRPYLNLVNTGSTSVPLSELKLRYWYTADGAQAQTYWCDYTPLGCGTITGNFVKLSAPRTGADYYLEIGFTSGSLAPNSQSGEIQNRFSKNDWSAYTQAGDYSFDAARTTLADWNRVTLYRNGVLIWGVEP